MKGRAAIIEDPRIRDVLAQPILHIHSVEASPDAGIVFDAAEDESGVGTSQAEPPSLDLLDEWLSAAICCVDRDFIIRAVSPRYAAFTGQTAQRVEGHALARQSGPANWAILQPHLERALAGEQVVIGATQANNGSQTNARRIELRPWTDKTGIPKGVIIAIFELGAPPSGFTRAEHSIPIPMAFIDDRCNLAWWNPAFAEFAGDSLPSFDLLRGSDESMDALLTAYKRARHEQRATVEILYPPGRPDARWIRFELICGTSDAGSGAYLICNDVHTERTTLQRLRESETHFRSFTENIPEAIAFLDVNRRYRYANQAFLRLINKTREEIIERSVVEVIGPELARQRQDDFERALRGDFFSVEAYDDLPGEKRWREIRYLPYRSSDGSVEGVYVASHSIDEHKRAEGALREERGRTRVLTDNVPAQISYLSPNRRYQYCNQRFLTDNGLTETDVIGHSPLEVFGAEIDARLQANIELAVRGERVQFERCSAPHAKEPGWWRVSVVADFDEAGTFKGTYGIAYDITEMKLAQERLSQQQQWIESFIENFPQSLSYIDAQGVYRYANRAFVELMGKSKAAVIGTPSHQLFPKEASEKMLEAFHSALSGNALRSEHALDGSRGMTRWMAVDWLPDRDDAGAIRGLYTLTRDISEAKRAQLDYEQSVREMQRAMDSVALPISRIDAEERVRFVNRTSTLWYGRRPDELVGLPLRALMSQDDYNFAKPYVDAALSGQLVQYEREMRYHDGIRRWVLLRYVPTKDESGTITGFYTTATDIQSRKTQELALQQANWLLSAHFENTPLASFTLNSDQRITRWSSQAEMLFGWQRNDVLERPFWDLGILENERRDDFFPKTEATLGTEPNSRRNVELARRRDGKKVACEWHIAALRDGHGKVTSILGLVQDVSQRLETENRLIEIAQRDTLTKLLNRNALEPTLRGFIERAKRDGSGVALLFIDLDHFKNVNDTLGHRVGDLMLIEIAATLKRSVRPEDEVARIGGDEFMIIVGHQKPKAIAHETAQRIIHALREPIRVENQRLSVAASIGVAVFPDHGQSPELLLRSADLAMYKAKENGKNRFEFFSASLAQRSERRAGIKAALKLALQRDTLKLYYQPRIDVVNGRMVGAEALLRWNDPRLGVVGPKEFINIAEESGLIHELGLYVFRKACHQAREWQDRSLQMGTISVNFSAHQLLLATFIDEVDRVIEEARCDPRSIEVEITETSMLFDLGITKSVIADLKHRGMHIAIDDFGTGFSSLSHLQQLDIDTLKIDQSFIRDMLDDSSDFAITRSVISLGRGLGLSVTAEGVENERQLALLREAGCDYYQGFYFSPAVAVEDLEVLLLDNAQRYGGVTS